MFLVLPLLSAFPALSPDAQEPVRASLHSLFEAPTIPSAISCPPARPSWDSYPLENRRLRFEHDFLFRESEATIDEDTFHELLHWFDGDREALDQRLMQLLPSHVDLSYSLSLKKENYNKTLLEGAEPVRLGEVLVFGEHRTRHAVMDFDVEIAQASFIADPVTARITSGTTLALQLDQVPDGSYMVQILSRHVQEKENEMIDLGYTAISGASRNPVSFGETGCAINMQPGQPVTMQMPAQNGETYELQLKIDGSAAAQVDPNLIYVPNLADPAFGFKSPAPLGIHDWESIEEWSESEEEIEYEELDEILDRLMPDGSAWESVQLQTDEGFLVVRGSEAPQVRQKLRHVASSRARSASVHLEVTLHEDQKNTTLGRFTAPVILNTPAAFGAGNAKSVLIEWDVEVAQGSRVADPLFTLIQDGLQGDLTVFGNEQGQASEIELNLQLAQLEKIDQRTVTLDHALDFGESGLGFPMQPADRVNIEEPSLASMEIRGRYPLKAEESSKTLGLKRSSVELYGQGTFIEVKVTVQ